MKNFIDAILNVCEQYQVICSVSDIMAIIRKNIVRHIDNIIELSPNIGNAIFDTQKYIAEVQEEISNYGYTAIINVVITDSDISVNTNIKYIGG